MPSHPDRRSCRSLLVASLMLVIGGCEERSPCPNELRSARVLIVVETETMDAVGAAITTYERSSPDLPWQEISGPATAVVGQRGLGWGWTFRALAAAGEPVKQEGDKKTPAGIFPLGPTFGFEAFPSKDHLLLQAGRHLCVDDVASPYYSRIVPPGDAGPATSGEKMWTVPVYKRGIVVDYPTSRTGRAGSCIFVHIWEGSGQGTSGCVAASEEQIARLQALVVRGQAVIAIIPKNARKRLAACLP